MQYKENPTLLFTIPATEPSPLVIARRELERAVDHLNDCVSDADKLAAEADIERLSAQVSELEAQAVKEGK